MRLLAAFGIGLVFGLGIAISGMINPAKVLNFFDLAGTWDPRLAVVIPGYRIAFRQPGPRFDTRFQIPESRTIDSRLILGSATFGIGWGIAGFCPGGALPALGTGDPLALLFVAALICGLLIARWLQARAGPTPKPA